MCMYSSYVCMCIYIYIYIYLIRKVSVYKKKIVPTVRTCAAKSGQNHPRHAFDSCFTMAFPLRRAGRCSPELGNVAQRSGIRIPTRVAPEATPALMQRSRMGVNTRSDCTAACFGQI